MISQLRVNRTKLQIIPSEFLFHPSSNRIACLRPHMIALLNDATLRGGFLNELIIIINDAFEIIAAIVQLPQLLVDRRLIMQNIDDEFFTNVLA